MSQRFILKMIVIGLVTLSYSPSLVKAQAENRLFEMIENPNSLNILDRHYNADGSIDYGIGNALRIIQKKNKDEQREKSILKIWDIESNEWVVYLEKKYIYKDNRLQEEQVWQYRQQVSLKEIPPRIIERTQHYFDTTTRTDSIVTTGQSTSLFNKEEYMVVTVNYLNQFDLPDSTLIYTLFDGKLSRKEISRMTYKEKELVEIATDPYYVFSTDEIPDKEHPFRTYTHFKNTPTTRTHLYLNAKGKTFLKQRSELDKQGRVCKEEIVMEGSVPLLRAEYQYDDQQRTIVHKVIYGNQLIQINGLLEKMGLKYDLTYTNDEEMMTYYTRYDVEEEFYKSIIIRLTYTPSRKIASSQIEYYNSSGKLHQTIRR